VEDQKQFAHNIIVWFSCYSSIGSMMNKG